MKIVRYSKKTKWLTWFCMMAYIFIYFLSSCQKSAPAHETPVNDSLAKYNLADPVNSCLDITVSGAYQEGKQLGVDENLEIKVNVSEAGYWVFKTDTVNGISFSGSGKFTGIGLQSIILYASGKPILRDNTLFPVHFKTDIYYFSVPVFDATLETEPVPTESYFKGTIDGVVYEAVIRNDLVNAMVDAWGSAPSGDSVTIGSGIGPVLYPNPPGTGTISLQKGFIKNYKTSTETDFKNFFQPGSYPFVPNLCLDVMNPGIIISWNDSDNQRWSTLREMADQSGSSFKIVGVEDGHNADGKYFVKVKMKFNCKIYRYPTGEMKELTNGEMVTYMVKSQ